ncbi:uncharacterized protein LOC100375450, partial [Saccoglossus kowalevskii]|uniref:Zinc/cadmium resistance protein-like n=1 Tax=Saccoglossus kowalevskii TaxID=10224 RepID=A0ABM0H042_SACKO
IARKTTPRNTFGWVRAEVMGAMINAVFLVALCFTIMVESLKRLLEIEKIDNPKLILVVGTAGLVVNLIGLALFREQGSKPSKKSQSGSSKHGHSDNGSEHGNLEGHSVKVELSGVSSNEPITSIVTLDGVHGDGQKEKDENPKMVSSAQLNMRAVFLHVMGDALGSVIVIVSALIIWFAEGDWRYYVDPAMSLAMVTIILSTTMPL